MKHRTIFVPMLMPKLSDQAAVHLIDILEQLLGIAQHHCYEFVHPGALARAHRTR